MLRRRRRSSRNQGITRTRTRGKIRRGKRKNKKEMATKNEEEGATE